MRGMAYFTCSRCGTVTSRELHWHAGEWCDGVVQAYTATPAPDAPAVGPFVVGPTVLIPDPPKEPK